MARSMVGVFGLAGLLFPAAVLAQQPQPLPWPFPGVPNPSQVPAPTPGPTPSPVPVPQPVPASQAAGIPVVFEVFTSLDCGACESAEYTVNRFAVPQAVPGAWVIPLAFHVEFYGGSTTTDPYVLPASTRRQQTYDSARGRVYTPQGIVDGDREFIASEDGTARTAIAAAARQRKIGVDVTRSSRNVSPGSAALSIRFGGSATRRPATVTVVLAEKGLLLLHHGGKIDYDRVPLVPVVRSVTEVGTASPAGGALEATVPIPAVAVRANLTAVVLLEDASSHHIVGVAVVAGTELNWIALHAETENERARRL